MAETIISSGLIIDGNLQSDGSLRLEGRIEGCVDSNSSIEIGPGAHITSDVAGKRVALAGSVAGNVDARERVDLLAGARLTGDVRAPRFTIADGANFRGKVDMEVNRGE